MAGKKNFFLIRMNKRDIISIGMMIFFIAAYLPVTSSWHISMKGRLDLSRLVISAMTLKTHLTETTSEKKRAQSIDAVFKELKFATGKIKVKNSPEKNKIHLTQIVPEFPLRSESFRMRVVQTYLYKITEIKKLYQSISLFIDPPPPKK